MSKSHSNDSMRRRLYKLTPPFDPEDKIKQYRYYKRFYLHRRFRVEYLKIDPIYKCLFKTYASKLNLLENHLVVYHYSFIFYQLLHWLTRDLGFAPVQDFYTILIHPQQTQAVIYYQSGAGCGHKGAPLCYKEVEEQLRPNYIIGMSYACNSIIESTRRLLRMNKKYLMKLCWMSVICNYLNIEKSELLTDVEKEVLNILDYIPTEREVEEDLNGMHKDVLKTHLVYYNRLKRYLYEDIDKEEKSKIRNYLMEMIRRNTDVGREYGRSVKGNKRKAK